MSVPIAIQKILKHFNNNNL